MKHSMVCAGLALVAAASCVAGADSALAAAQKVFVTGILASFPDPNGKVPALDVVPGAGIDTWSDGLALGVLTANQYYEYCVSVASAKVKGTGSIVYAITRGHTVIQTDTVVDTFKMGNQGVWYFCAGYHQLPSSPGPASMVATLTYTPKNGDPPEQESLSIPVLLQ
jgi:hypothetical protein